MYRKGRAKGFTLIELIVTLAVLAILLAVGVPAFNGVIESSRLTTQANALLGSVNYARSEAVKRGETVSIQGEAGGFGSGWCVIIGPLNGCQNARDNGLMLREFQASQQVVFDSGGAAGLSFDNRGYRIAPAGNIEIGLQPDDCAEDAAERRVLSVSLAGRASLGTGGCE